MPAPIIQIVTADLYDLYHQHVQVCQIQFRTYGAIKSFFGRCATLKTFEDHTPVLRRLEEAGEGRVLVVDAGGSMRVGVLGDRLAGIGLARGWAGIVIHGVIRDSLGIDALNWGVKALGATARRGWDAVPGLDDVNLEIGSVLIEPGDWIYADQDSVLVSKSELDLSEAPVPEMESHIATLCAKRQSCADSRL